MASNQQDPQLIPVRCDSCGARFEVKDEKRGKVVECVQCSHRILVQGHVTVHASKSYPGERRDPLLDQLAKVKKALPKTDDGMIPDPFDQSNSPGRNEPASPQQIMACTLAVLVIIITALVLVLGASHDGALSGVSTFNRMLIAGFTTIVATALLIYTNTKAWLLMLLLGFVLGGGLISLPAFFQGGAAILGEESQGPGAGADTGASDDGDDATEAELRDLIGTKPLEKERSRLLETPTDKTALGLWMHDLEGQNCMLIREYIIREMNAAPETHFYPRGRGDFLMVVTGIYPDLERLASVATALGEVNKIHKPLHIIEVTVDNSKFKTGPIEQLTDSQDPKFYLLNLIELKSIDLDRIDSAVRRLSEVKPALLQDDIEKRLIELLASSWYEKKGELCRALLVWADDDGDAGREALAQAVMLRRNEMEVPEEMIALCIKQKEMDVLPLLYELWRKNTSRWEPWFREAGEASERIVLLDFDNTSGMLRQSACRILGQVGGELSLPILKVAASTAADQETRIVANHAMRTIRNRLESQE